MLSADEFDNAQSEAMRRKKYDNYSIRQTAYELYSAKYKGKLKCGTKTIVN